MTDRTISAEALNRLRGERDEADRRYNNALTTLDRAIRALPEIPHPPPDIDPIDLGEKGAKLVPMIHFYISPLIPPVIEVSVEGSWIQNSEYHRYLGCFREELDSLELKVREDYDFGAVDQHVDITPLNESACKILQRWDLENEEIVRLWLNRNL